MIRIAITGGIGSGKSAVCTYLEEQGYKVIYADKMARAMTEAGGKAIPYIREHFGDEYILEDGSMNRAMIRELVYSNPDAMAILEKGTTEVVIQDIEAISKNAELAGLDVLFYEIPLLFESGKEKEYDSCWLITADTDIRIERVMKRDGLSEEAVRLIIAKQMKEEKKLALADEVVYNNKGLEELRQEVNKLLCKYSIDKK